MKNLPTRDKFFWKQLFQYFVIVGGVVLILGMGGSAENPDNKGSLLWGLFATGIIAIVVLGFKIALEATNDAFPKDKDKPIIE